MTVERYVKAIDDKLVVAMKAIGDTDDKNVAKAIGDMLVNQISGIVTASCYDPDISIRVHNDLLGIKEAAQNEILAYVDRKNY